MSDVAATVTVADYDDNYHDDYDDIGIDKMIKHDDNNDDDDADCASLYDHVVYRRAKSTRRC